MVTLNEYLERALSEELDMRTIKRYIPTGAKVDAEMGVKNLKLTFTTNISAPPLVASDVERTGERLKKDVKSFVEDVNKSIKIKKVDYDKYVHLVGQQNSIDFVYSFRLNVSTKPEERKLEKLYQELK